MFKRQYPVLALLLAALLLTTLSHAQDVHVRVSPDVKTGVEAAKPATSKSHEGAKPEPNKTNKGDKK